MDPSTPLGKCRANLKEETASGGCSLVHPQGCLMVGLGHPLPYLPPNTHLGGQGNCDTSRNTAQGALLLHSQVEAPPRNSAEHHPHSHRGQGYVHASATRLGHGQRMSHFSLVVSTGRAERMAAYIGRPVGPPKTPKGD